MVYMHGLMVSLHGLHGSGSHRADVRGNVLRIALSPASRSSAPKVPSANATACTSLCVHTGAPSNAFNMLLICRHTRGPALRPGACLSPKARGHWELPRSWKAVRRLGHFTLQPGGCPGSNQASSHPCAAKRRHTVGTAQARSR
jgi:hypothetical protein